MRFMWGMVGGLLAAAPIAACSDGATVIAPSGHAEQFQTEFSLDAGRIVVVLAVDDGPSRESASVRETAKGLLRTTFEDQFVRAGGHVGSDWARADLRVVVVHPSAAGSARAVGPSDDAALAVVTDDATTEDIDAMADATGRAIDGSVAADGAPYALLDATARTIELVTGARAPRDAREAALAASVGTPEAVAFVIATSRDDEGPEDVGGDAPPRTRIDESAILAPKTGAGAPCSEDLMLPARLGAWAAALEGAHVTTTAYDPACADDAASLAQSGLLGAVIVDFGPACLPAPIAHGADGAGACVVTATMFDAQPCSTHPGMIDPRDADGVRRPRTAPGEPGPTRVCEIVALAGEQALACGESAACTGCGPGWCDFAATHECTIGGALRIVHGATPPGRAVLDVACDVASR
jgi:hypothetical protein